MRKLRLRRPLLSLIAASAIGIGTAHAKIDSVDRILAIVNSDVIVESEVRTELASTLKKLEERGVAVRSVPTLARQILEQLILQRVQLQEAEQSGIRVSEEELSRAVNRLAENNKLTLAEFRDAVEKEGMDYLQFREDLRHDLLLARLKTQKVERRVEVSDAEVDAYVSTLNLKADAISAWHLGHILIGLPDAASPEQVQAALQKAQDLANRARQGADFAQLAIENSEAQDALEGGDLGWRKKGEIPSLFTETVMTLNDGEVSDPIRSGSGFHLVKLIETQREQSQHVVEKTKARHILLRPNELVSNDDAQLKLNQLRERIIGGDDFAELARAHSEDGSARSGGDLGWVNPADLVPEFVEEMDKLQPGELSAPFKSRFGWHIIQVEDRRQEDNTQEFLAAQARDLIRKRKIEEETENWLRRLRDEAYVEYRLEDL